MFSKKAQSYSRLQQICQLDIDQSVLKAKLTSIIGTIGPACDKVEDLKSLIEEGMTICRMNLAYRNREYFREAIKSVRQAQQQLSTPIQVAIGIDITGPGIRMGYLQHEVGLRQELKLKKGDKMKFTTDRKYHDEGTESLIYVDAGDVFHKLQIGNKVVIENGPLALVIKSKGDDWVECEVEESGELGGRMLWTVPGLLPRQPKLSQRDKEDLQFAIDNDVDIIFASWVWCPELVQEVQDVLGEKSKSVKVIAKIENYEGVKRFDEILKVADGIMIARGSLGINIQPEKVFLAQKMMIGKANRAGKPVICATQMLASMIQNPRPTRAEVADVANAILDGADCVMLSRETARGRHPVNAMKTMKAVCQEAESAIFNETVFSDLRQQLRLLDTTHTTAIAAVEAAHKSHARAIVVITSTGRSAAMIAKYRPNCVIVAITRSAHTANNLQLYRGVFPVLHDEPRDKEWINDIDFRIHRGLTITKSMRYIKAGDIVILVTGWTAGAGSTNTVRIITCPESDTPVSFVKIEIENTKPGVHFE